MLRLFLAMLPAVALAAPAAPTAATPPLMLGASWYPEQWPEARWDADLALMQAAGLRMVRVGEFAWSSLEPEEGRFTLDWLDRAIAAAAAHHILVVLGTPTDAPPAWLTSRYPETLRVDENGRRLQHGERRQFSYTSAKYRELCRRIVGQLARRFGHNPDVIGWQIGNEYTEDSFDAESRRLFHEWLQAKYQTLDALNRHWTTAYWSQTYDSWDEIPMGSGRGNPGLLLDYKRFVTDEWRSFQRNQLDVIRREADPRQFITTNLGGLGWADRFNRREIAADLDLVSWDTYVGQGHVDPYRLGATHDLVRGWKGRNFWVMEMQPGSVDWAGIATPSTGARPARWSGRPSATAPTASPSGNGAARSAARNSTTAPWWGPTASRCPSMPRRSRLRPSLRGPARCSPAPRPHRRLRSCTTTTAGGPSISIRRRGCTTRSTCSSATTARSATSRNPSTSSIPPFRSTPTSWWWRRA